MGVYWVVEGRCVHPLCVSQQFIGRPDRGTRCWFYEKEDAADEFLKHSESRQRRCPDCRRPIARRHFRKIRKEVHA